MAHRLCRLIGHHWEEIPGTSQLAPRPGHERDVLHVCRRCGATSWRAEPRRKRRAA